MKITKVTVKYGRTFSLPGYSNVKPEIGYEAEIEPGEDVAAVKAELQRMAQAEVEEACDQALEEGGNPAHFDKGPRYDALRVTDEKFIAIVPAKGELPETWKKMPRSETGWRFGALLNQLTREWSGYDIQDCGLPEVLPALTSIQLILTRSNGEAPRYCVILPYDFDDKDLDGPYRYGNHRFHTLFTENVGAFASKVAQEINATLIDCLDGDLSKLPDLAPKEPVEQAIADGFIPDIEFDDDDEDDYDDDDYDEDEDEDSDEPSF